MNEHLEQLKEIRSMMERSSKFLSLSGLSGISAGFCALAGAWYVHKKIHLTDDYSSGVATIEKAELPTLISIAFIILVSALITGIFFTVRKAKNQGLSIWNETSKRLVSSLMIPLLAGGLFCLGMLYHGFFWLCFPATLVFYGVALVSASRYTVRDTFYLGLSEIILGIISLFLARYNLVFWAIGFGILHIIYGSIMYFKYDIGGKSDRQNVD